MYLSVTPVAGPAVPPEGPQAASVLLSDPAPMRLGAGIVLAVAPLAGVDPYIDRSHANWLHLRVRAPLSSLLVASGVGDFRLGHRDPAARKLADGHWTLAFADGERAGAARDLIARAAEQLRGRCTEEVAPLLGLPAGELRGVER